MKLNHKVFKHPMALVAVFSVLASSGVPAAFAACPVGQIPAFPGSDMCILDPASINKYELPLVIPPVMKDTGLPDNYEIAVRQFSQQILPGGIWNTLGLTMQTFPATRVWSYGPKADPTPAVAPDATSQFNYPAYTVETMSNVPVSVRWLNELVVNPDLCNFANPVGDPNCNFLPHILPIDQTLHWANPPQECRDGSTRTDCAGDDPVAYNGPVPIVTHVHGAHVDPHSDGYPEAWWLPKAGNIPAGYATEGSIFDDFNGQLPVNSGYADYWYRQDQPATTLWYHDHSLGMTRNNVYAGPAGFWLVRGGAFDGVTDISTGKKGSLPGPAPKPGQSVLELNAPGQNVRSKIREIPIVIQDRDFMPGGSALFYPDNRAHFEMLNPEGGTPPDLEIDFVPDTDIAPIWNPEAFFNVMVVNGVAWPKLEVAQALYRFRFLNGCNSRFLWLKFNDPAVQVWQIGAEQGFLPAPQNMALDLDQSGDGTAQILMALAERADVIVDFTGLADGAIVDLINIGPDEPFGGGTPGSDFDPADPNDSGKVMRFVVNAALNGKGATDPLLPNGKPSPKAATSPANLALNAEAVLAGPVAATRQVSLNEADSEAVCVVVLNDDTVVEISEDTTIVGSFEDKCTGTSAEDQGGIFYFRDRDGNLTIPLDDVVDGPFPFGPKEALLGTVTCYDDDPETNPLANVIACDGSQGPVVAALGNALKWTDAGIAKNLTLQNGTNVTVNVTENPTLGNTEDWEIYNFTVDGHPIHLHLVRFQVMNRTLLPGLIGTANPVQPWETGFKDTVIAYPGEITTVRALFDIAGLYVWHCHIVEHEDNEMMRPYVVSAP